MVEGDLHGKRGIENEMMRTRDYTGGRTNEGSEIREEKRRKR